MIKSLFILLTFGVFASFVNVKAQNAPPSDTSRAKLHALIDSVTLANVYSYDTKDNLNQSMDCAKVIEHPSGGFIAVYHHYINGQPTVFLATSPDFISWTVQSTIATIASQPAIAEASDGGYVIAWEQEPNNHIKVAYYSTLSNLLSATSAYSYDISRTLSSCAEGTPNIYSASSSSVDIGFHYYQNCQSDRQARGVLTNFKSWSASALSNYDNALLYWGVAGNIGDRDAAIYDTYLFGLIEGQFTQGNFGTWRSYIYDYQTGNAEQLHIVTHNGSTAFANPTFTFLNISGNPAMVVTLFVPSEGAASGEAGELMYYRLLNNDLSTAINTQSEKSQPVIYPNPTSSKFFVSFANEKQNNTNWKFKLTDLSGKTILQGDLLNKTLELISVANGEYQLQIFNDTDFYVQQLIVSH